MGTRLIGGGRSPATPALAVENAGRPDARLVRTTLGGLAQALAVCAFTGPVVLVIGQAAAHARPAALVPERRRALV